MAWGWKKKSGKQREKAQAASEIDVEAKALAFLAARDHSTNELRKKLKDRGYPMEHIDAVIKRFSEYNYLNDERVSTRLAESLARSMWGPIQIRGKMRERGFDSDTIDQALSEIDEEEFWIEHATRRVRSKFRKDPKEMEFDEQQKAWRHLAYRGYPGGIVKKALSS